MPTRTGYVTVIAAFCGLVSARVFGIFELYIVAAAMLALVACAVGWVVLNWRSLAVARQVTPSRLHAGHTSTVTLSLSNSRLLPTPVARITDQVQGTTRADAQVPPIRRGRTTRASYRVPTERRGLVEIGPMRTRVTDPFGLASSSRSSAPDVSLLVLPPVDLVGPPPPPGGETAVRVDRSPNRVGPSGEEFSSLRSYVVGDDLRKVHWPSTARGDELVVRNEHLPEHGESVILLDVRAAIAEPDTFERMVSAAASIALACYERGDIVQLVTTAGASHTADSPATFDAALDFLAVVEQVQATTLDLTYRIGQAGNDAAVLVIGRDIDSLLPLLSTGSNRMTSYLVRFLDEGAKPPGHMGRLPSTRMIDVPHDRDFAAAWAASTGLTAKVR